MDRFESMRIFAKVVEARSFTTASAGLGISTSMVSQHVKQLEERLGARLINRTTRRMNLTEVGRAYYDRCKRLLSDLEEAESAVGQMQVAPRGEFSLVARQIASCRMVICGAPAYFKKHEVPRTLADLANHNCLTFTGTSYMGAWHLVSSKAEALDVPPKGNLKSNNAAVLLWAALEGQGLVAMPSYMVGDALKSGDLRTVLDDHAAPPLTIRAVYPHSRHLSAKVRTFVDFLAARFGREPPWERWPKTSGKRAAVGAGCKSRGEGKNPYLI